MEQQSSKKRASQRLQDKKPYLRKAHAHVAMRMQVALTSQSGQAWFLQSMTYTWLPAYHVSGHSVVGEGKEKNADS